MSLQIIDSIVSIQVEQQVKEIITVLKPMLEDIISGVTLEYMDYQQASEYLGVSVGTIRKYVSQYGLPVIKLIRSLDLKNLILIVSWNGIKVE